jgi:hypothetical protein
VKIRTFPAERPPYKVKLSDGTEVCVPSKHFDRAVSGAQYKVIQGYTKDLLVFKGDRCCGWIKTKMLGYPNVTEFGKAMKRRRRGE